MTSYAQTEEHEAPPLNPPRILFLSKVLPYPPAVAGDAVYSRGVIEAIAGVAPLTVLCAESGAARRAVKGVDWHVAGPQREGRAKSVLSRWPLIAWKGATPQWHAELDSLLTKDWDVIILDNIGTAHALPKLEAYRRSRPAVRLVYLSHEQEYEVRRSKYGAYGLSPVARFAAALDLNKVRRQEERLLKRSDLVTVINENDASAFRKIAPRQNYFLLTPGYDGPVAEERRIDSAVPRRVLLLGGRRAQQKRQILLDWMKVGYRPLTEAGVEIVIVGDMDEALSATLKADYPQARALGFVDDLGALIASARAGIIADTVGGGFKLRLLSHIFQRLPIIGLDEAISGLPTARGEGYLSAPDLASLSDLICETIDDTERLDALQQTAFEDCAQRFSWEQRARDLLKTLS
ncbi:hypothetical protein [Martelella lutilitoris]|uniref:hypothetical protein n=1 Tax=Martelella lutilitoris TaxID=2583532 RepID=UPI001FE4BE99|nr:hypothetical protein [Martelella lutilitoris]